MALAVEMEKTQALEIYIVIVIILCASACNSKSDTDESCETGEERCDCREDGSCNKGLTCLSDLCVRFDDEPTSSRASENGEASNDAGDDADYSDADERSAASVDSCIRNTCKQLPNYCGTSLDDGCGGPLDCSDACFQPDLCVGERCCTPKQTCSANECGVLGAGCGTEIDCGECSSERAVCYQNRCCIPQTIALACRDVRCNTATVSDGCGGRIDCSDCAGGRCYQDHCCVPLTRCPDGASGVVYDDCGGTIWCGGECEDYLDEAPETSGDAGVDGCEQPTGAWEVDWDWEPSVGTCELEINAAPNRIDDIEEGWWDENEFPGCNGLAAICDDGCFMVWDYGCPFDTGAGYAVEYSVQRLVSPIRIEGTYTKTHYNDDGTHCSKTASIVLTKL